MKKKVYIIFQGGLGNQLFQYAFGVYVKKMQPNVELVMDYANYHRNNPWRLKFFCIPECEHIPYYSANTKVGRMISGEISKKLRKKLYKNIIMPENSLEFMMLPELNDGTCLKGFWQNALYYLDITQELKHIFKLKNFTEEFSKLANLLTSNEYCAIHVRRGDYATFYDNSILPESYYSAAIRKIDKPGMRYMVFSDDIKWCRNFFDNDRFKFVSDYGKFQDYEELMLISKCKYHIIANSTFSWWGAYLSDSKCVICPYYMHWDERFYMPSWIGMEVNSDVGN